MLNTSKLLQQLRHVPCRETSNTSLLALGQQAGLPEEKNLQQWGNGRNQPAKMKKQSADAGEAPPLVEEDVSNFLGKLKLLCEAKLVDACLPRPESSPSVLARLAVTSQSAVSPLLQGSWSPARASPLNPISPSWQSSAKMALQLESENKPSSSSEPSNNLLVGCHPAQSTSRPSTSRRRPRKPYTIGTCYEKRGTTCRDCSWSSRSR
jgi:hypothetical protein